MAARKKKPARVVVRDLTRELGTFLEKTLVPDLTARAKDPAVLAALMQEHEEEKRTHRTSDGLAGWIPKTLEQIGAAWLVSCVFVRTLEDRKLLAQARIAGEGAKDSQALFEELFPALSDRDYLLTVFREVAGAPGAEDLLGPAKNPAWKLAPSGAVVRELLALFRETDADGALVFRFDEETRPGTRFLGDLYQDVSAGVRERFALLQTPDFVEELILDQTLTPAIAEYGLDAVRVIDPTCGSGHFLLGAFARLLDAHRSAKPALDAKSHANLALAQIHGVDLNPYAVAIARFRLVLAYLEAAQITRMADAPALHPHLAVGDSLLLAVPGAARTFAEAEGQEGSANVWGDELFGLDDRAAAETILAKGFHVVVGNPPYITCKDAALREAYRERYVSAAGKYALAAPFTERFFQLAIPGGFVGMINANSFMKREFGKKLIEAVLKDQYELTRVVDTSGAYIPGHGTPTVLLFGRNRRQVGATVKAVLGKRGEPSTPAIAAQGVVWRSLADHLDEIGFENEFLSVAEVPRTTFDKHPWSLGGGGAAELKELLEERAETTLEKFADDIGFASFTGLDDLFIHPRGALNRRGVPRGLVRPMVIGESVRDWAAVPEDEALSPYNSSQDAVPLETEARWGKVLWPFRAVAERVASFGGKTRQEEGQNWWSWYRWQPDRYRCSFRLSFAFVATHNHFFLDRGGNVFNRSAPIIKLPMAATEGDHFALLAYLNSSTVGYFLRQAGHSKGAQGVNEGHKSETWEQFLEYSAGLVGSIPLPFGWRTLARFGRELDALACAREALGPDSVVRNAALDGGHDRAIDHLSRMVAVQEALDFEVYRLWRLTDDVISFPPMLKPGSRRFEHALEVANPNTRWFSLNGYDRPDPATADAMANELSPHVRMIEQPEYKRRWTRRDWTSEVRAASRTLLAELTEVALGEAAVTSASREIVRATEPAARARNIHVALGEVDELDGVLLDVLRDQAVPFLAALRHTDAGLDKRAIWEETWALQRREDAGETVTIAVPPKYDSKDFRDATTWRLRGKLDVPQERFISYPGAEKDDDPSPIFAWAGWDHLAQARALTALYVDRKDHAGWGADDAGRARLVPLLAGLLELLPWLLQWHDAPHDDFGGEGPGTWYARYIEGEARALGQTLDALRAWRPIKRGRKG